VRRDTLPAPDVGFAFLPQYEGKGYGFESAEAIMRYGRETLNFERVLAITSLDNEASGKLLLKLGFVFDKTIDTPEGERLNLYSFNYTV
jgi:RimJ/RimL family protein N-acetyltransferase